MCENMGVFFGQQWWSHKVDKPFSEFALTQIPSTTTDQTTHSLSMG